MSEQEHYGDQGWEEAPEEDPVDNFIIELAETKDAKALLDRYLRAHPEFAEALAEQYELHLAILDEATGEMPDQLDCFDIYEVIGTGGMGVVYEAYHPELDRLVAVKTMWPGRDLKQGQDRFQRERKVLAHLHDTHIAPIYHSGNANGIEFFVMPFIDGTPLDRLIKNAHRVQTEADQWRLGSIQGLVRQQSDGKEDNGETAKPMSSSSACRPDEYFKSVARVMADIAASIHHAHQRGIVHRDIKPKNLILDTEGSAWLIDFGVSAPIDNQGSTEETAGESFRADDLTGTEDLPGTLAYMAPEQFEGKATPESVVWGLGGTLYHLLTLKKPFDSHKVTKVEEMQKLVSHSQPERPRSISKWVPKDLEAICMKSLEKCPGDRYDAASELADDLNRYVQELPVSARPLRSRERFGKWCRRNPLIATLSAALVIIPTALAIYAYAMAIRAADARDRADVARVAAVDAKGEAEERAIAERDARKRAEEAEREAKIRQARFQQVVAQYELDANQQHGARVALTEERFPDSAVSWDTKYLKYSASFGPQETRRLIEGYWGILGATINSERTHVVTSQAGGLVLLWDLESGQVVRRLVEGRYDSNARRWRHHFEALLNPKLHHLSKETYTSVAWVPGTSRVVAASYSGKGVLFDSQVEDNATPMLTGSEPLQAVAVSDDGKLALFGGVKGGLYLRSPDQATKPEQRDGQSAVSAVRFVSGLEAWLVGREDGRIELREMASLEVKATATVPGPVWSLSVSEKTDGTQVAVGAGAPEVRLFSLDTEGQAFRQKTLLHQAATNTDSKSVHL